MAPSSEDIDDFELIRRMADQEADFAVARHAWGVFYVRHYRHVLRVAKHQYGQMVGEGAMEEIVQDGLIKAFNRAKSFGCEECCIAELQQRKVRAWVIRIIQNLVRDSFSEGPEVLFMDNEELAEFSAADQCTDFVLTPESVRLRLLKSGFKLLSEIEQTVLLATIAWFRFGAAHQRMPHSEMEDLAKRIHKSPENIRKIRSRAMKTLKTYINDNLSHENSE